MYTKCMNALQQVIAREGRPILVCEAGDEETKAMSNKCIEIPHTVDCLQVILVLLLLALPLLMLLLPASNTSKYYYYYY